MRRSERGHSRGVGRAALAGLSMLLAGAPAVAGGFEARDALWSVVQACGVAHATVGLPVPCTDVRTSPAGRSVALVRAPVRGTHLLVVPLSRIPGIESPELQGPAGGDYAAAAWEARDALGEGGRSPPWDWTGMAVNSVQNRSQDQLHVHVDCLARHARSELASFPLSRDGWRLVDRSHGIWGRLVRGDDLRRSNPFAALRQGLPIAGRDAGGLNLGVAGIRTPDGGQGFALLASRTHSFEGLLDHTCSLPGVTAAR